MKKIITIILGVWIISSTVSAQQIGFGIKAGLNISNVEGDWNKLPGQFGEFIGEYEAFFSDQNIFDPKSRIGAHGGLFFNIPVNENFSVEAEVLYSMRGTDFTGEIDTSGSYYQYVTYTHPVTGLEDTADVITFTGTAKFNYDINYKLHYIDIPVLVKFKFNNGLVINAGPYFSFLASSEFKYNASLDLFITQTQSSNNITKTVVDDTFFVDETEKNKAGLKSSEAGFIAGLGYQFPFGLEIHTRYMHGLTEVFDNTDDDGFRTSVIQFGVSYKIFNDLFKFQ